jgi:hypothetical protein
MGLLNMVRGEGSKIIQLFGRRVRLKVKGLSLKRILPQDRSEGVHLDMLEAMSIFAEISSSMNVSCFLVGPNIQHGVQPANAKSPSSLQAAGLVDNVVDWVTLVGKSACSIADSIMGSGRCTFVLDGPDDHLASRVVQLSGSHLRGVRSSGFL